MDGGGQDWPPRKEEEEELARPSETLAPVGCGSDWAGRAEIDTSAPFESVKEAVDHFGGSALWKSQLKQLFLPEKHEDFFEEVDVMKVEEQAAKLEKDLIAKEKEALDVLKELEMTKKIVDGLKLKLQKEAVEVAKIPEMNSHNTKVHPILETGELHPRNLESHENLVGPNTGETELKQAKMNLNRATGALVGIRASVASLNVKIEKEKALLERTREKLASNTAEVSSLEEDLCRTNLKLQVIKGSENPSDISREIKKMTEAAKSEVSKLTAEIEQSKTSIKTAEIRWVAAKKMEEAAKAAEAVAIAEIKDLMGGNTVETSGGVTLSVEEYVLLSRKAQEADEVSRKKIEDAMLQVDEANRSKFELLAKVEEAVAEAKTGRRALEEALSRLETANRGKLAVEEALRRWRSEHSQKRRPVRSSPKFKNSGSAVGPTLSIGQILSRKLLGPEDYHEVATSEKISVRPKVSLGQILSKRHEIVVSPWRAEDGSSRKQFSAKRKKFSFVGFSFLTSKQNRQKKTRRARSP